MKLYTMAVVAGVASAEWAGFQHIKYAFVFGDSYTQTGFDYLSTQPSPSNPLGNPPYPGWTSANGPNWIDYLTVKYNTSRLQTYNLASGGATVDAALVTPWRPTVLSLIDQVQKQFIPGYVQNSAPGASALNWTGDNSLFAVWIGINDVGNSYWLEDAKELNAKIVARYAEQVDALYTSGGRNFVFLNVPPTDRSPLILGQGDWAVTTLRADIEDFNGKVSEMAKKLKERNGTNVWVYDANKVFGQVLDDPSSHAQTAGYKNVTGYCPAYENGTPAQNTFVESCGVPVNQYFWLNSLHPTSPVHEVVAEGVAKMLEKGSNVTSCARRRSRS